MVAIVNRKTMLRNRNSVTYWVIKVNGVTADVVKLTDIVDYKEKLFNDTIRGV